MGLAGADARGVQKEPNSRSKSESVHFPQRRVRKMKGNHSKLTWFGVGAVSALLIFFVYAGCSKKPTVERGDVAEAAIASYVAPGDTDEYYLFYSGGHSGNVYVAGVPSMRHISTIPVFAPYPATGYGFDKESKEMLGAYTWGDVHHPALSEINGH